MFPLVFQSNVPGEELCSSRERLECCAEMLGSSRRMLLFPREMLVFPREVL